MLRSLRARLLGSMLLVTGVVVGTTLAISDPVLEHRARSDTEAALRGVTSTALYELDRGADPRALAERLATDQGVALAIYGPDDTLLARAGTPNPAAAPLSRVRSEGSTSDVRDDTSGPHQIIVSEAGGSGHVVRASQSLAGIAAARETLREVLVLGSVFALLMAVLLSEYLSRAIGRPIREMTDATDAVRGGDLTMRVRSRRDDELGALGQAIDDMADQLVERFDAVRREEARLRTILDAMVEGVFVTDADGRIVLTNAALTKLAGGNVEGRTAIEAIRSPELHEAVRRATAGQGAEVGLELPTHGPSRSITAHIAPLPGQQGVVAVLHDVTQLKRADAVRRDFVANASHELRTPLTSIRGFAETLLDGALADERMARRFVGNIVENARRLQSLVDDLLELSRAESPDSRVELAAVDARRVAAQVLAGVEQRAAEKRIQLVLEGAGEDVTVRADARALDQVLLNLVDNAIKYTPDGGRVTVRFKRNGERVAIEVADNGPGIPRVHHDRIFERFYRVDKGRSRAQGGTGLGLSIVKHLVQRMEGDVSVESRVGHGSVFRVSLPAAQS